MTCHLLPFVSYLDQPHLLRDLVAFRCHRRQWHHGPGGSRFFASADDTGLQLGRLSSQPPGLTCLLGSPASWAHLPPGLTTSPSTPTATTTTTTFLMATVARAHKGLKMMIFV